MAFDTLRDLRASFEQYMDDKVKVTIPALSFAQGSDLNPNEEFFFDVVAQNLGTASDGIAVKDLRFSLQVSNANVFRFIVPQTNGTIQQVTDPAGNVLAPGALASSMVITISDGQLLPGESEKLDDIRARTGPAVSGGTASITARVFGNPDLSFIFPENEFSLPATRTVVVEG